MIKRWLAGAAVMFSLGVFATPCHSLTLTDVGGVDTLVGWRNFSNNGDAAEMAWLAEYLGITDTTGLVLDRVETTDGANWEAVVDGPTNAGGDPLIWALEFATGADAFIIKTGNDTWLADPTVTGGFNTFLYDNNPSMGYAVIDLSLFQTETGRTIDIFRISHVSSVPEPGTLLLLGAGLAGLGILRRKRVL